MSAYRITVFTPQRGVMALQTALETISEAQAAFEAGPDVWRIDAYADFAPDPAGLTALLSVAAASVGVGAPDATIAAVEDADWAAATAAAFPPLRIGRFIIHGGHVAPPRRAQGIGLQIEAGAAFGTGEHATTQLCLESVEAIAKARPLGRVLDMGCGTGVLAFGAIRLGAKSAIGIDIDKRSARLAAEAARVNGLAARCRIAAGDGFSAPLVRAGAPFDLLCANILARPLMAMAPAAARVIRPGGFAVLSGLLTHQERMVFAAWRLCGFVMARRRQTHGWSALTLKKI